MSKKEREQASNTRRWWLEGGCEGKKDELRDEERSAAGKDDERQRERERVREGSSSVRVLYGHARCT